MADQDREAAVEAQQDDELDLTLRLRPAPSRRSLHLPNPAAAPVRDDPSDLSMTVPILGEGGTRSEQEPDRLGFPDLRAKRVAQALRRREARKKRDEKRKSKVDSLNERMLWFENRRAEGRESEGGFSELRRKGGNCNGNGANAVTTSFLVRPVGGLGLFGSDGNGFQPVVGAGRACEFRAHCGGGISDNLKRSVSSCSRGSSSGASDYQSTSGQGGSSSDAGSHSSNSHPLDHTIKYCPTPSNDTQLQTSHHNSQPYAPQLNNKADCGFSSYQIKPNQPNPSCYIDQNPEVHTQASPGKKPMPTDRIQSPSQITNKPKLDPSKPPKPMAHHTNETVLLPKMPCVVATGNGPDGKRITGFLYKYTKTEVSIVCVCHGTSFSPAGFVEHAGGVGIQNPLRHITISTSAFNP